MKPKGSRLRYSGHDHRMIASGNTILRTQVGSGLHGIAMPDQDDRDEMGICIEPPYYVIGPGTFDQYEHRTAPIKDHDKSSCSGDYSIDSCPNRLIHEHARSGPGDLDLVVYGLRKWMRLALNGNPTILLPLFAPPDEVVECTRPGSELRDLAPYIISQQCGDRFLKYLEKQRADLEKTGRGKKSNRPELIERYGFDVKYAAHMIRIAVQGTELMRTGRITLPMEGTWRLWLRDLRHGNIPMAEALGVAEIEEEVLRKSIEVSKLAVSPDAGLCWMWVTETYLAHWKAMTT